MKRTALFIALILLMVSSAPQRRAVAQERSNLVPLKVQLVVSRQLGDKKISSLPYTLWMTANDKRGTSVRMGVQVPVATSVVTKEGVSTPSYNYRDVGTNIDCQATTLGEGIFNLEVKVNDSSLSFDAKESTTLKGIPAFRNFASNFSILLKDGQTAQYASATDPVSGETLKVDVTLNVLK